MHCVLAKAGKKPWALDLQSDYMDLKATILAPVAPFTNMD